MKQQNTPVDQGRSDPEGIEPSAVDAIAGALANRGQQLDAAPAGGSDAASPNAAVRPEAEGKAAAAPGAAADLTPAEEIRQLRDRLARVEGEQSAREAARLAEDARDDFIRNNMIENMPRDLLRQVLPATTDKNKLHEAADRFTKQVKQIIQAHVDAGRLRYVDWGGGAHPHSKRPWPEYLSDDPVKEIAAGLALRQ